MKKLKERNVWENFVTFFLKLNLEVGWGEENILTPNAVYFVQLDWSSPFTNSVVFVSCLLYLFRVSHRTAHLGSGYTIFPLPKYFITWTLSDSVHLSYIFLWQLFTGLLFRISLFKTYYLILKKTCNLTFIKYHYNKLNYLLLDL